MSWQVVNKGSDHTQSIQGIIKDYLASNWSLTAELTAAQLLFSTGWWQKQPQYIVNVRHDIDMPSRPITLGSKPISRFDDRIQVHCWATEQTDDAEPTNLDKMNREVERLINSDYTVLESSQGLFSMKCSTPRILPMEDSQATIFHSIQKIQLFFMKRFV